MSRKSAGKIKTIGYLILVASLIALQPLAAAQSQSQSSLVELNMISST